MEDHKNLSLVDFSQAKIDNIGLKLLWQVMISLAEKLTYNLGLVLLDMIWYCKKNISQIPKISQS